jgi:hypothetical protein
MVKQSAVDAGLAAALYLALVERRRAPARVGLLLACGAIPVAAGLLAAASPAQWWSAVVAYHGHGDSILTGSLHYRLHLLADSLPAAAKALALMAFLAALGWRRSPPVVRLWLGTALLGALAGGSFHPHYYIQLVPPLAVLGGSGVARLLEARNPLALATGGALGAATLALTAPLWLESSSAQARAVWPHDGHLVHDRAVARYLRAHTRPRDRVLVLWGAASVYYLADREPAVRYMWLRNFQTLPAARRDAQLALARKAPRLVAVVQPPDTGDGSGRTAEILRSEYEQVATVEGVPVYRPRRWPGDSHSHPPAVLWPS